MAEQDLPRAWAALAHGDVLIAFDAASSALESRPGDVEAQFVTALTLARAGATERAEELAADLPARLATASDPRPGLREDVEALSARIAKDKALATEDAFRTIRLRRAADMYAAVALRHRRPYSAV